LRKRDKRKREMNGKLEKEDLSVFKNYKDSTKKKNRKEQSVRERREEKWNILFLGRREKY
jgi:hypothetical protein